jgi:hypothetical protein
MGYRIDFAERDGTLSAHVSGKASLYYVTRIARDIAGEAARKAAREVLVDVRLLLDRVGTLGTLLSSPAMPARVAVVDLSENDAHYVFAERIARRRGRAVRCFGDSAEALRWLRNRD